MDFVHNDCPEGRVFDPFKSCPRGLSQGGMVLDEIDTCINPQEIVSKLKTINYTSSHFQFSIS